MTYNEIRSGNRKACLLPLLFSLLYIALFFFFQAEDGIRVPLVTGVQTCALPIFFFFQAECGIRDATVTGVQTCALPISVLSAMSRKGPSGRGVNSTSQAPQRT